MSSTARKVGRCLKNSGRPFEKVMFFAEGDAANLKKACEARGNGVWLGR
ncbi:MAG TPA: hypothetical protein VFG59_13895 [Anaeromyxobacter sp.]|nr:hypothetical protein [Anaeromyxobacter sp.]